MTYATLADMQARFNDRELIQLTDESDAPAAIDEIKVGKALTDASGLIDSYIGGRYTLPLATVPHQLVRFCCDIAWKYLWGDRASEQVQKNHDAALKFLEHVSAGKAKLDVEGSPAPSNVGSPIWTEPTRVFTDDALKDY